MLRAANEAPGESACAPHAVEALLEVRDARTVLLDRERGILREYLRNARESGEPGVGDAFLKWLLVNLVGIDTDYWEYQRPLREAGVAVGFMCRDALAKVAAQKNVSPR